MTDFTEFWAIAKRWRGRYSNPRKGRGGAEYAWDKVTKDGADPDQICLGAHGYVAHIQEDGVEPQKVCMATTFLNQWRWEQYVEIAEETREREVIELLERRRSYYRYGWRDFLNGDEHQSEITQPEVQEAYDRGWRDAGEQAKPKLEVVG